MFVSEFTCPCCGTIIQPANPTQVGRRVQCYACRTTFEVTAPEASPPPPPDLVRVKSTYSIQPGAEHAPPQEEWDNRPVRRHFRTKRKPPNIGLIAVIITGSIAFVLVLVLVGALAYKQIRDGGTGWSAAKPGSSLVEARRGFKTKLVQRPSDRQPAPEPPASLFRVVHYQASVGPLAAYLTLEPTDGEKHPAMIWITGGDCNSIDQGCWGTWSLAPFRRLGIVMMFPSLRGGNDNPGVKEGFLGEVDDVLAAADYLAKQDYVDPNRIYLGGHSTGGTLALLVAECSGRFRAVFSFGPADNVARYPPEFLPFDMSNRREIELRSPGPWLGSIKSPTFVFEGTVQSNIDALRAMARSSTNPNAHFLAVRGVDHFAILPPVNRLIADKVQADNGPVSRLSFTEEEINRLFSH